MKVTIGIPLYNAARWIEQSVESCLSQNWLDIEVIVVDDGSTDASLQLLQKYKDRITLVCQKQRGSNFARNRILALASGQWIQFLDADDYLLPDKISKQLESEESRGSDVIFSPVTIEAHNGGSISRQVFPSANEQDLYLRWINWELSQTGTLLWKKNALLGIGGWNVQYQCCQDNEICFRALKSKLKFSFVDHPGAVYRVWSNTTISNRNPALVAKVRTELLEEMLTWLDRRGELKAVHANAASTICFRLARSIAKNDYDEGGEYFKKWRKKGLIRLDTADECSAKFRFMTTLLGFKTTEKLSSWVNRHRN